MPKVQGGKLMQCSTTSAISSGCGRLLAFGDRRTLAPLSRCLRTRMGGVMEEESCTMRWALLATEAIIPQLPGDISGQVRLALAEDVGSGDVSAALIPEERVDNAVILYREEAIVCGCAWVEEIYAQLGGGVELEWNVRDGDPVAAGAILARLRGPTRVLLTGERTALNFLQLLSAVATCTRRHVDLIQHTGVILLDTRKTIPGLRTAQKYAVGCGGGRNHRMGLHDALLLKENHIAACGGIQAAIASARARAPHLALEIEVESLEELREALAARPDIILLDNFSVAELRQAVSLAAGQAVALEASGGITTANLVAVAETGVDFVSIGKLTKSPGAIDLSLLVR